MLGISAIYAFLIWAHGRVDGDGRPELAAPAVLDASRSYRALAQKGPSALVAFRESLLGQGRLAQELSEIMPRENEPWRGVVKTILRGEEPGLNLATSPPGIVRPRGLVVPGRPVFEVMGMASPVTLKISPRPLGAENEIFQFRSGQRFTADLALDPGTQYRLVATSNNGTKVESLIQVLSETETQEYRRRLRILKQTVSELSARSLAQVFLAMSGGLHDAASTSLLAVEAGPDDQPSMRGLDERRLFLLHRAGRMKARNRLRDRMNRNR